MYSKSMPPRPRRAAAVEANKRSKQIAQPEDPDADPGFMTLSQRQRRTIDRAFARGCRSAGGKRKRRKTEGKGKGKATAQPISIGDDDAFAGEGGFVEAGGFVADDDPGGGFLADDDGGGFVADDDDNAGGFMADEDEGMGGFVGDAGPSASTSRATSPPTTQRLPLSIIPGLLVSLGLPSDDDVLQVFRASATGWEEPGAKRGRDEVEGVELKDFRAVCAALMDPEDAADGEGGDEDMDEDAFELSGEESESSLSSISSQSFAEEDKPKSRRRKKKMKDLEENAGPVRLSSRQKDMVADIWKMLKPDAEGRGARILGRDEVRTLARGLGEMWTDEEITDMIALFSSQHEGRGLSYEDFGNVMLKAGLV